MRAVPLILVIALVYDAVANDSAYTKKAWNEVVAFFDRNTGPHHHDADSQNI